MAKDEFQPSLESMLEQVHNKYTLTMVLAKRARKLNEKEDSLVEEGEVEKPLSKAMDELVEGDLNFDRIRQFERETAD